MSVKLDKDNFSQEDNTKDKGKIIQFPDRETNFKETPLIIKGEEKKAKIIKFETNTSNIKYDKKRIGIIALIIMVVFASIYILTYKNAQEVYVGDKLVATINLRQSGVKDVKELTQIVLDRLKDKEGANVEVNEEITLKPVRAAKADIMSVEQAIYPISKGFTFKVEASVITVDGEVLATVKSEEEANKILNNIKNKYIKPGTIQLQEPTFLEDVKVENKYVAEKDILTEEQASVNLNSNKNEAIQYEIKEGDTLFEIAMDNDMSLDELLAENPNLTEDTPLKIGSKVNITASIPLLSVQTYEKSTYTQVVPKKIEKVENNKEYKNYKKVLIEGKDGSKEVTAKVIKVNGVEQKREVLSEKVIVEPKTEKVEVGTLNTPPKKAIGSFIYPVSGRLSSGYGYRWGTLHKGIDIAAPSGTPIKASDGGTVTFSGWNDGGYGYMVKINHGNGFETVYAHNSKLAVNVGQKVAQGEVIAYVGNTGNSTGNHVHFEVIKNGATQNPINYLK